MSLSAIYAAIAARTVSLDGSPVTTYAPAALPNALHTAQLPARLLLPSVAAASAVSSINIARTQSAVTWVLADLMLYTPIVQKRLIDIWPKLIAYTDAYALMLRDAALGQALISSAAAQIGVYQFGDTEYFGVEWTLSVQEFI